jgi:hypothetical protein
MRQRRSLEPRIPDVHVFTVHKEELNRMLVQNMGPDFLWRS